ncbi:MAG: hypothetical protein D6741_04710 [Planctomycetota bacterium]|nr:MAG: hypothetical protein D6741_04710 [Planctomycetota bacterium]
MDIHGVFEKEYRDARSSTEARALLARTLLKEAAETSDDPAVRYTLYDEARTLAVDGESPSLAIEAVDSMGLYFQVDTWQMHVETIEQLAKEVDTPQARDELVQLIDRLIDSAIDADRYDVVPSLAKAGTMTATKLRDLALRDYLEDKQQRAKEVEEAYLQAKAALEQLRETPDDPSANTIAGAFYCFAKREWARGLPMLVKGDNAMMKTVAQADLAKPTSPRSQLQLADDWWALADTLDEPLKSGARRRAGWWYIVAGPQLRGEELERARQRAVESGRIVDLLDLAMKRKALTLGSWQRAGGLVSSVEPAPRVQFNVFAPERYRLDLTIEPLAAAGKEEDREKLPGREGFIVGLPWRNYWFTAVLDWGLGRQGNAAFLALYDGKGPDSSNPTFRPNKLLRSKRPNYVSYEVTDEGVTVSVNRIPIIQYTDSYDHLKMPPEWAVPGKRRIFIGTRFCSYRITKADLIDLED